MYQTANLRLNSLLISAFWPNVSHHLFNKWGGLSFWCYKCVMDGTFWQWWRPGTWSDNGIWSRAQECVRFSLRCSRPSWLSSPSSRSTAMKRVEINSLKDALNLVSFVRRTTRGACFHVSTRGDESLSGRSYWSERYSVQLWSLPPLRGFCYDMNSHSSLGFRSFPQTDNERY